MYRIDRYLIDFNDYKVYHMDNDSSVSLSVAEANILKLMFESPNHIFSKTDLEQVGWEGRPVSTSNLTVAITALRKKLTPILPLEIANIPRKGYLLKIDPNALHEADCVAFSTSPNVEPEPQSEMGLRNDENPSVSKSTQSKITLTVVFSMAAGLFIIAIAYLSFHVEVDCNKYPNDKTICSSAVYQFNELRLLDDMSKGDTAFVSKYHTLIYNQFNHVSTSIYYDED